MSEIFRDEVRDKIINGDYNCAKELTLSIISGKWKIVVLWQLRELIEDGVVHREIYPEVPPKVV